MDRYGDLDWKDEEILRVLLRFRRRLSASFITKELNKKRIKISRPTVTNRLHRLRNARWVINQWEFNPRRLPRR